MQNSVYVYALRHLDGSTAFLFRISVYSPISHTTQQTSLCTAARPDPDQLYRNLLSNVQNRIFLHWLIGRCVKPKPICI